jgi:peptidoglycan hydrolase CwlO-like protein
MKKITLLISAIALALLTGQSGVAQRKTDLKQLEKQVESLQKGQAEMQKELKEIKSLLQALQQSVAPTRQEITLSVEGLPFKGDQNAKLTIVEFSDYQ